MWLRTDSRKITNGVPIPFQFNNQKFSTDALYTAQLDELALEFMDFGNRLFDEASEHFSLKRQSHT